MDYTIEPRLKQLDSKIQDTESRLLEDFKKKESSMLSAVTTIKADISKNLREQVNEFKQIKSQINQEQKRFELDVREHLDAQDQQNNQRDNQIYNSINSLTQQMRRMHFDIIDNEDNLAVTYVNPDGKIEYGAIKKFLPDNTTIKEKNGVVSWNYTLDPKSFDVSRDNNIRMKPITELTLNNGKKLSVDRLNNDLNNATYNIQSLTHKVDSALKKLNTVNGYVASNNFKTDKPSQDQLTDFAINCLSTSENKITKDLIPNGTKIKNTYNQHIWILNRINNSGLTTIKWEDFGSDNICVASNDGVHGLVTGSQNRFRGYVDINGVISINGLEEELNSILEALTNLSSTVNDLKLKIDQMEK